MNIKQFRIQFTPAMKKFLRQQMVLTEFELEQILKQRRRELFVTIQDAEAEIKRIDCEIEQLSI